MLLSSLIPGTANATGSTVIKVCTARSSSVGDAVCTTVEDSLDYTGNPSDIKEITNMMILTKSGSIIACPSNGLDKPVCHTLLETSGTDKAVTISEDQTLPQREEPETTGVYWVTESGMVRHAQVKITSSPSGTQSTIDKSTITTLNNGATAKFKKLAAPYRNFPIYHTNNILAALDTNGAIWGWDGTTWTQLSSKTGYIDLLVYGGISQGTDAWQLEDAKPVGGPVIGVRGSVLEYVTDKPKGGYNGFHLPFEGADGGLYVTQGIHNSAEKFKELNRLGMYYIPSSFKFNNTVNSTSGGIWGFATANYATFLASTTPPDTNPPVIQGANDTTIPVGSAFDPKAGVTATDDVDGDITSRIQVNGSVDTAKLGSYEITYTVSDTAGNKAEAKRTITVTADPATAMPETGELSSTVLARAAGLMIAGGFLAGRRRTV